MSNRNLWIARGLLAGLPVWACALALAEEPKTKPAGDAKPAAMAATTTASTAAIGKPAPEFTLKDTNGKEVKLSSFKGKVVVLEWINHECPVVQGQYSKKNMPNTIAKFKGQPVQWLSIDSSSFANDKLEAIKKWVAENKLEQPYLLDAPGTVGKMYGAKNTPHMFVIDQKGNLAYMGAIDDNADGSKTSPRNYVEEAVNALIKGSAVPTPTTQAYGCSVKYKA